MKLSSIYTYPIKSCRGIPMAQVSFDSYGLANDRRYAIVNERGIAVTQRDFPILTFVEVKIVVGGVLEILAPTMSPCIVEHSPGGAHRVVRVWDDTCTAVDCGDRAAEWFSDYLNTTCRLVKAGEGFHRLIDRQYSSLDEHVAFADGYPALLISEASLADLNARLGRKITMERFRPNLVVDGCPPFSEDRWKDIRIGTMTFRVVKPCSRCVVTTVDPHTAESGHEPLKTLATFRAVGGKVLFGQNVIHNEKSGLVRVGDPVEVIHPLETERNTP